MAESRWMFSKEQLQNTPSRKSGIDAEKELSYRQQAANLIQDMGQRLNVTQLCINTAIVYMHRFYMFQSFTRFPRNERYEMAPACLFLAAKLEEQPRKLEHVIKVAHSCLHRDNTPAPDPKTDAYLEQAQNLVINENILLQTLGFEVSVDHPHSHVVKATSLVKASKDLAQTSYFLATNSLHLTTLCLQYRPTIVACVCIYLACKWSNWKIPRSHEGKEWYQYVDISVTSELLDDLYNEFLRILEKCPHKLRKKIMGWKGGATDPSIREGEYQCAELTKQFSKEPYIDPNRSSATSSLSRHKHTNHDRNSGGEPGKHPHPEQKHLPGHPPSSRDDPKWQQEKLRPGSNNSSSGSSDKKLLSGDRKPGHPEHREHGAVRKEHGLDRRDGPPTHDKDGVHSSHHRAKSGMHGEHRERSEHKVEHHDMQTVVKKEPGERSHPFSQLSSGSLSRPDLPSVSVKKEPMEQSDEQGRIGSQSASDLRRNKSETSLHYKEYLKRKELEKQEKERNEKEKKVKIEKERLERDRHDREKEKLLKQSVVPEQMNKTFPPLDGVKREPKHRPPKLDMNLSQSASDNGAESRQSLSLDRPYEVNIKSPIKPHHNIVVKSPIKSSELKQPRLEIMKVQLTPEKDGSEAVTVNINNDPNIKRMVSNSNKHDAALSSSHSVNHERGDVKGKYRQDAVDADTRARHELKIKLKQEQGERLRQKLDTNASNDTGAKDFNFKTQDSENGDSIPDSAAALRQTMKLESGSGRSTPISSQTRTDAGSGTSTPIRLKLSESSPLKIKISTKGLQTDSDASSSKHESPHRHHHKHKDKHKSHKRSKDKHRDKERSKDHDRHNSSSTSTSHGTNNGQPLKLSFKLSDIQGHSSSSNESWSVKNKHGHKKESSVSDTSLNRNNSNSLEAERQQPWSMSDLISKPARPESESRKRRRGPVADPNNDALSHPKNAKLEKHRIRRSSSSHSIVSMDMSDEDNGTVGGEPGGAKVQVIDQSQVVNKLQESLQQAIEQSKLQISKMQRPPAVDRQQSGFDLDGMMWAGISDAPPPPPPPPPLPPLPANPPPRPR